MAQNHLSGFVANGGQFRDSNDSVRTDLLYTTDIQGAKVYITKKGLHFVYMKVAADSTKKDSTYRMDVEFNLGNTSLIVNATDQKTSYNNYFYKNQSYPNVKEYGKLTFVNVWPNINLELTSDTAGLKFRYNLAVNANPQNIQLKFVGGRNFALVAGKLNLTSAFGDHLSFLKHTINQNGASRGSVATISSTLNNSIWQINTTGTSTSLSYTIDNKIDDNGPAPTIPAVVDNLKWATYYGGSSFDILQDVQITGLNQIIVCGSTNSVKFPITINNVFQDVNNGGRDAFVAKFRADRSREFSTYFGGSGGDEANSVTSNSRNEIIFCGTTNSTNYPLQPSFNSHFQPSNAGDFDGIITKLSSDGQYKLWSTYYGGNDYDEFTSIAVTFNDRIYAVGETHSSNFTTKILSGAFNQNHSQTQGNQSTVKVNGFITQFIVRDSLLWSTYYGGKGLDKFNSVSIDNTNQLVILGETNTTGTPGTCGTFTQPMSVCGPAGSYIQPFSGTIGSNSDIYIVKFNAANQIYWATCYGGAISNDYGIYGFGGSKAVAINYDNDILLVANTNGTIPMPNYSNNQIIYGGGTSDAFILRFSPTGVRKWASYLGGNGYDIGSGIAKIYPSSYMVVGSTTSSNFPILNNSGNYFDPSLNGFSDGFQTYFSSINNRIHSTYVGGNDDDYFSSIASANEGQFIASVGLTEGINFPVRDLLGSIDYFDDSYNLSTDGFIFNQTIPCIGNTCRIAMNMEETKISKGFTIFPNPSSDLVTVQIDIASNDQIIEVFNIAGQLLEKINIDMDQNNIQLDFSTYTKGIYLIKLQNKDSVITKSIVIQ